MGSEHRVAKMKRIKSNLIFQIKKIKNQKKWTKEEDDLLIQLAEEYSEKNWKEISKRFLKKNSLQCFSRYKRIRPGIVKGSWKKEEDLRIMDLVSRFGKAWSKISKTLGTRNGKQIRDRYINVLDPEIKKGKFTEEEDRALIQLYNEHGSKWATIAKYYPNRTADMIKNRFHSSIKKKLSGEMSGEKNIKDEILCRSPTKSESTAFSSSETNSNVSSLNNKIHNVVQNNLMQLARNVQAKPEPLKENIIKENYPRYFPQQTLFASAAEQELYLGNSNILNSEFAQFETKNEEGHFSNEDYNWNFEDYFTI